MIIPFGYFETDSEGGLPLDVTPMIAGWSFRKLRTAYSGYSVEVRRSSDDAITDVELYAGGAGSIDLSSTVAAGGDLGTWASTDTVYIRTFYNQGTSGSSFDQVQTINANQATLITAGTLNIYLGLTNAVFASDGYTTGTGLTLEGVNGEITAFWVGKPTSIGYGLNAHGSNNVHQIIRMTNSVTFQTLTFDNATGNNTVNIVLADTFIDSILTAIQTTTDLNCWLNTSSNTIALTGTRPTGRTNNLALCMRSTGGNLLSGNFFEAMYDIEDRTSERVAMRDDINIYYSIF